ncbi:MAG: hypothetical protein E7513_00860 [Ruminococcaceae bacterium]|nr:hypothetical protein [Oscillospiraceae bacterium]
MNKTPKKANENKQNKRTPEQKAATRKLTSRIVVGVLVALVLVFIVFIFVTTNFMGSESLVTEVAYRTTVSDSISTTGFVIRDEVYIDDPNDGVLVYQVSSGDKITANGTIATIYNTEADAVNYQKFCDLQEEIDELENLNNAFSSSNIGLDSVNNRLDQKLISYIDSVNNRDFVNIATVESDLLSAIYRKQIITGDQKNFDDKISQLEEEMSNLESTMNESIGEIKSKDSGYFVSTIDGYENCFSLDDMDQITYTDIKEVKPKKVDEDKYVGKIIKGVNWYLACPVTKEQAVAITHSNTSVSVRIPYASNDSIPAKVISVNQFTEEDMAVVIIECNYMSPALSQIRNEAVDIDLNTYEGLKVNKAALHDDYVTKSVTDEQGKTTTIDSKVQGVYVKYGSQLLFKQVYIVYSDEDYVICSENPTDDVLFNGTTVALYDEVVVEGDDLYNGKLVD